MQFHKITVLMPLVCQSAQISSPTPPIMSLSIPEVQGLPCTLSPEETKLIFLPGVKSPTSSQGQNKGHEEKQYLIQTTGKIRFQKPLDIYGITTPSFSFSVLACPWCQLLSISWPARFSTDHDHYLQKQLQSTEQG